MEPVQQNPPTELDRPPADPLCQDQVIMSRSQSKALQGDPRQHGRHGDQPPKQVHPRFRINDRVVVYNKARSWYPRNCAGGFSK